MSQAKKTVAQRLWEKVTKTEGCWLWNGAKVGIGYGHICVGGKYKLAHRVAYELEVGPIPVGLTLDHLCSIARCVNPAHLEPVTMKENCRRRWLSFAGRAHCLRGHAFTHENTYITKNGKRRCRACVAKRAREQYARSHGKSVVITTAPASPLLSSASPAASPIGAPLHRVPA